MRMRNRIYFAPDDEQGTGSIEEAVAKLSEMRGAAEKEEKPAKVETPKAAAPEQNEPEPAPEQGDEGNEESTAEKSDEEKLADEIAKEKTPSPDSVTLPPGWRGEADAALFKTLTPETQQRLLRREGEREAGIAKELEASAKVKKEAAAERDALKAERQKLAPILQSTINGLFQQLVENFPGVDPRNPASVTKFALEHPEQYGAYDALWKQIGAVAHQQKQVEAEQKEREEKEHQDFSEKRVARLLELDESLKNATVSASFEKDVVGYLMSGNGYGNIDPDRIKHYTAEELLIARDAMKYRMALAGLKKAAEKAKEKAPTGVKPGAGVEGKTEEVAALEKRARKSGKIGDAVSLMQARRKAS